MGGFPTDPMLVNGPVVNRALLNQLYPATALPRNTGTVQYDSPDRQMPRSTQVSVGYERQLRRDDVLSGSTTSTTKAATGSATT